MAFPKHILDFILRGVPEVNSNEEEMLAKERNRSFLDQFASRPSLEAQGLVPMPTEEMINSPTFKPDVEAPVVEEEKKVESMPPVALAPSDTFTLNIGNQGRNIQQGLAAAEKARDESILRHQVSQAGKQIGAGISGAKLAPSDMDKQGIAGAGGIVQDYLQRIKMDEQDPNSPISKAFKQYAQKYNVNVKGDFTAAMGKELLPFIFKSFEAEENRKLREELAKQKREELSIIKQRAQESKDEAKEQKDYAELSKRITGELQRSNTPFGKMVGIIRSAEAIEQLAAGINPNQLDSRQITEIARNLDAMLSSGAATISGMKKLIPESYSKDAASILEYISSRPKGAGQGEFVKRMLETVAREKELAKRQVEKTQGKLLTGYSHLYKKDKDKFNDFLRMNNIPEDIFQRLLGDQELKTMGDSNTVTLRRKSTGTMKKVSQELADQYIASDPKDFEIVK